MYLSESAVHGLEKQILELLRAGIAVERMPELTRSAAQRLIEAGILIRDRRGWKLRGGNA